MNQVHMSTTMNGVYQYCDDNGWILDFFMKSALSKFTVLIEEEPCPLSFLSFTMTQWIKTTVNKTLLSKT